MTAPRGRGGFSLLEVLIAMTMLVVGMTGILALFTTALQLESEAEERTEASLALPEAVSKIEAELGAEGAASRPKRKTALTGEFDVARGGRFVCRWEAEPAPGLEDGRALLAHVVIVVNPRSSGEKSYDFGRLPVAAAPPAGPGGR